MSALTSTLRKTGSAALSVARQPSVLLDLGRWVRDRRKTTMELRRPWWPYRVAEAVSEGLPPGGAVFEFGGGGSTLWLYDKGAQVTVVEHHRGWYEELRAALPSPVTLVLVEPTTNGTIRGRKESGYFDEYVNTIADFADSSLDLVIVDGRARVACGMAAKSKVKPGGMLLLDDSNRPRYSQLVHSMADWHRKTYRGLKPGGGGVVETTIWRRPAPSSGS